MTSWQHSFRVGFAPLIESKTLLALKKALDDNDSRLIQGATTTPPPLQCVQDFPVEAACAMGWCGATEMGGILPTNQNNMCPEEYSRVVMNMATVGETEEWFALVCYNADQNLGEPGGCRFFLNWYDSTPREQMRQELSAEIADILQEREEKERTV